MSVAQSIRRRARMLALLCAVAAPGVAAAQPQQVAGVRVVLQPPAGFSPAVRFPGFQREAARASIMVTEVPAAFSLMESRLTPQAFAGQGMVLRGSEPFAVDSLRGRLISASQQAPDGVTYDKWVLMFGDDSATAIVTATYPQDSAASCSEPMKQAVLTARWSRAPADPLGGIGFRVTTGPRLRIATRLGNSVAINETGTLPNTVPGAPLLVIGTSVAEVDLGDLEAFARRRLMQMPGISNYSNVSGCPLTIDGAAAHQLTADAVQTDDSTPLKLFQVVLPEGSHYILVQGLVAADRAADFIPEFQAIARSLHRDR
ncbi:MAG TPA: hypothetical protein VF006_32225 [Longimicrobium sp.]